MSGSTSPNDPAVTARLAALDTTVVAQQTALEAERELRVIAEAERDRLREAYEALKIQVELAHRRLVIAKAEYFTRAVATRTRPPRRHLSLSVSSSAPMRSNLPS